MTDTAVSDSADIMNSLHHLISASGPNPPAGLKPLAATDSGVDILVETGLVKRTGKKLTITDAGWSRWFAECNDSQRAELFVQLLQLIDERDGKKLTKGQAQFCEPQLTQKATEDELIEKVKAGTYLLTDSGQHFLLANLPEAEGEALVQAWQEREDQVVCELLSAVEAKSGKALTKAQRDKFEKAIQQATSQKLIGEAKAKNAWQLTAKGGEWLFARLPAEQQFSELEMQRRRLLSGLRAVQQKIQNDLADVPGEASHSLQAGGVELGQQLEDSLQELETNLAPLRSLVDSAAILKSIETTVRQRILDAGRGAVEQQAKANAKRDEARAEIEQEQSRLGQQIERISDRLGQLKPSGTPQTPNDGNTGSSLSIDNLRSAWERVYQRNRKFSGSVSIPELYDELKATGKQIPLSELHRDLSTAEQQRQLTMQVCNSPSEVDRPGEGIRSQRGLLYYVRFASGGQS